MTVAEAITNLVLFMVFPGVIGMTLLLLSVLLRQKSLLVTLTGALVWLGVGFWWILADVFTAMGLTGDYLDLFYYVPFLFFVTILAEYMTRANKVEIQQKVGGYTFSEFGERPRGPSDYEKYKAQLQSRVRGRR